MVEKITMDGLAGMVKHGFDGVDEQFKEVRARFDQVDEKLDRIENYILKKHEREIEHLKLRMQNLEDMFAIPAKK